MIDKPITCSVSEVKKLIKLANEHGAILSGGSSLEYHKVIKEQAFIGKKEIRL